MKSNAQRLQIVSVMFAVLFMLGAIPAYAAEDAIASIRVNAALERDGSAVITEIWDVRGVSGGTEYYKALNNMNEMRVHDLLVWDETGTQYETLDSWDTDLTLLEKAGTCGILETSNGYELCWGIGSYGDHQYTIQYTMDGLVKDYGDYAGFYHQFISELSSAPESAAIDIHLAGVPLTEENARIWGYGFPGEVEIGRDGVLHTVSSRTLGGGDYVNVLCRFEKDLFPLAAKANMSFEALQESAEGGDSAIGVHVLLLLGGGVVLAVLLAAFLAGYFLSRYRLADGTVVKLPRQKELEMNSSIPFGGSIPSIHFAMGLLHRKISHRRLMGAYLIRWQKAGYISIEERAVNPGTRKAKKEEVIVFASDEPPIQGAERTLHQILAGGADRHGILWTSDIEESAQELYEKLTAWAEDVQEDGQKELLGSGAAAMDGKGIVRFTAAGFQQAVGILGLQKYLEEMHEQGKDEAALRELWGEYLVFSTLFDTAEQVLESMKALDPAYFDTFSSSYGCNAYSMMYFITMTNHISSASAQDMNGTDGTGGMAGSMGGGGFSGGGGGGSR